MSDRVWDDLLTRAFFCPAIHVYRSMTLKDNTITVNGTDEIDAMRIIGSLAMFNVIQSMLLELVQELFIGMMVLQMQLKEEVLLSSQKINGVA